MGLAHMRCCTLELLQEVKYYTLSGSKSLLILLVDGSISLIVFTEVRWTSTLTVFWAGIWGIAHTELDIGWHYLMHFKRFC